MTTARFLATHWQKQPLLVRGAFAQFTDPLTPDEVLGLATTDEVPSRAVSRLGRRWEVAHGPFSAAQLARRPKRDWTVLVQDTNFVSESARALLAQFDFIPHARVDDLMVSYAEPGGTVGPHVDSYDVFLIQGQGRRRWQISRQRDLAFVPGLDLKILARFVPEEAWTLEPGDMLYLPPGVAHHGVALERCLTWSVGFRAPSDAEFAGGFLDHLADRLSLPGQYRDPGLRTARHPGLVPEALVSHVARTLRRVRWSRREVRDFVGAFLSEPKNHALFTPPARPLTAKAFAAAMRRRGVRLDGRSRLLASGNTLFLNGEAFAAPRGSVVLLRELADQRSLPPGRSPAAPVAEWLHAAWLDGALHIGNEESTP